MMNKPPPGQLAPQSPEIHILQVQSPAQFQQFEPDISALLNLYQHILLDDFCEPDPARLAANTATYLPWLWLLVGNSSLKPESETHQKMETLNAHPDYVFLTEQNLSLPPLNTTGKIRVYGLACLSQIIPGRHAYVHGVSHPAIRRHPAVSALGQHVLSVAFGELQVRKVKAEIEAHNRGAIGYCRRMGFVREAHFRQDNRLGGQWQDVLVYSLFAEQFEPGSKTRPA